MLRVLCDVSSQRKLLFTATFAVLNWACTFCWVCCCFSRRRYWKRSRFGLKFCQLELKNFAWRNSKGYLFHVKSLFVKGFCLQSFLLVTVLSSSTAGFSERGGIRWQLQETWSVPLIIQGVHLAAHLHNSPVLPNKTPDVSMASLFTVRGVKDAALMVARKCKAWKTGLYCFKKATFRNTFRLNQFAENELENLDALISISWSGKIHSSNQLKPKKITNF